MALRAPASVRAPEAEPCRGGGREGLVLAPLSLGLLSGLLPTPSAIHSCEDYGAVVINRAVGTRSVSGASASLLPALAARTPPCQPHLDPFNRPGRAWVTLDLPTLPASLRLAYRLPYPPEPGKDTGIEAREGCWHSSSGAGTEGAGGHEELF